MQLASVYYGPRPWVGVRWRATSGFVLMRERHVCPRLLKCPATQAACLRAPPGDRSHSVPLRCLQSRGSVRNAGSPCGPLHSPPPRLASGTRSCWSDAGNHTCQRTSAEVALLQPADWLLVRRPTVAPPGPQEAESDEGPALWL